MSGSSGERRSPGVVLLDTSAVIAFLQGDDAHHVSASMIISGYLRASARLAVSAVTLTELFTGVVLGHQEEQVVSGFLEEFDVLKLPFDEAIAMRAAQIRGKCTERTPAGAARPTVRVPDALILATADLHPQIESVLGADRRWNQAARGLTVSFVYLGETPEVTITAAETAVAPGAGVRGEITSMYRRLPHGRHGMGRDAVMRHQRARMFGAMIEAVHPQGYRHTTVAQVVALAGVSRRAFWEQFANKEDCFLGTYDIVVARAKRRMLDGWEGERGWANRMTAACRAVFADSAKNSKGTSLVLVRGFDLGPRGLERMVLSSLLFERALATGFANAPDGISLPPLGPKAIVGGGRYLMFDRLLSGREAELALLSDEVLDWIAAYRSPVVRMGVSRVLPPRQPSEPARFLESEGERARLLGAATHLLLDEGYGDLTDQQIAQFAGVSTRTFHKQFISKQECLLAVVDAYVDETLAVMIAASANARDWPESTCLGVKAAITHLAMHPGLTRISLIDVFETGSAVVACMARSLGKLADTLATGAPEPKHAPAIARDAVAGALWTVVLSYAGRPRLRYLPAIADHIAFLVLAPYVGPKTAAQTIERMSGSGDS